MKMKNRQSWATVKHFRLAVALVEFGSVSHAASALNISQPTASKLLNELEQAIGSPLFNRNRRGVTATELGRAFAERGKIVLAQIESMSETIELLGKGNHGHIAIGVMQTSSSYLVPAAVDYLLSLNPSIQVKIVEGVNSEILSRLISGELDFILGRQTDVSVHSLLHKDVLFNEKALIVARPNHSLVSKRNISLEDFRLQSWILPPPETSLRKQFDDLFYRKNLRAPLPAVETASFFNTLGLLKRRDILGILPGSFIFNEEHHSQLICLPTFQPLSLESICILRLKNASLSPASVAFVDSLREVLKRLSTDVFNGVRASI